MFLKKKADQSFKIDSLIGANMCIDGTIQFSGGLRIDGVIRGNVLAGEGAQATLVISRHGRVEGHVVAAYVIIDGEVVGETTATETLDLQTHACVRGDVYYRQLEVHAGAVIHGKMLPLSVKEEGSAQEELEIATTDNITYLGSTM